MNTWQWIALVVVSLQVYYPVFYPGANRWLWKKTFRWCNYAVAVLQAVIWLVLKVSTTDQAYDWPYIFLVSPFVFYSLHLIFDRIIWRMYTRRLVITSKGVGHYNFADNAWDQVFSAIMIVSAILVPFLLLLAAKR